MAHFFPSVLLVLTLSGIALAASVEVAVAGNVQGNSSLSYSYFRA